MYYGEGWPLPFVEPEGNMDAYRAADRAGPMTIEELEQLPDDEYRCELVRGWLVREPPPGGAHGYIAGEILVALANHVKRVGLGWTFAAATGFILAATKPQTVRAPDASFVVKERLPHGPASKGHVPLAPDLAVEVVSPTNRWTEIAAKVRDYLDAGTRLVWIVDPDMRTVTVHRPGGAWIVRGEDDALEGEDVVPGFRVRVGDLFVPESG
jgi:Uma2 family endonuclease